VKAAARSTKIVCTIGPATDSEETISELIDAGMNVARLNFSHGTRESHLATLKRLRNVSRDKNVPLAILQDLSGPKIRVGIIENGPVLLKTGEQYRLTSEKGIGDEQRVSVTYDKLPQEIEPGDQVLLADGSIELKIAAIDGNDIVCDIIVGGQLSSNKGINLPGRSLSIDALTEKDKKDLEFGLKQDVDYVAMSFVRRAHDVEQLKRLMAKLRKQAPVIAKIEKHEAIQNLEEIVDTADGIMVARGDLAVETPLSEVPIVQKKLIALCNSKGKPVITATQMLKSMVDNPRPTRAEANDVANAVLDGTDAVMLSEETTVGKYPVEAVHTMAMIIEVTENSGVANLQNRPRPGKGPASIQRGVCHAAFQMAEDLQAAAILTPTQSGSTPRMISSYRPDHPIIALSPEEKTVRQLCLIWGVYPMVSASYDISASMIEEVKSKAIKSGLVQFKDTVVIAGGMPIGAFGTTNFIKAEVIA